MVEQRRQEPEQHHLGRDDDRGQRRHEPGRHAEQDEHDGVRHAEPPGQPRASRTTTATARKTMKSRSSSTAMVLA
ncbi:hypothetical protein [Actinomadura luteofluorescens]|uniref:hypothetical protein n=1 Tax=Actinomadura luteofluorescens TaxID=46163 RepID=UPI003D8B03AC